jgi:hypothetical protein
MATPFAQAFHGQSLGVAGADAIVAEPPTGRGKVRRRSRPARLKIEGMRVTYAVSWEEPDGSPGSGRLELGTDALLLEGASSHRASLRFGRARCDDHAHVRRI